jgi:hypothetical protein
VEGKSAVPEEKQSEVDAPKYGLSRWQKTRNSVGLTLLIGVVVGVAGLLTSLVYAPPSSMRGQDGRKFSLFEHVFNPSGVNAENLVVLEENISKKLIEIKNAEMDSTAAADRKRADSVKAAMAMKKMEPRKQPVQRQQMRVPQKH